jgi:hypothetical protein
MTQEFDQAVLAAARAANSLQDVNPTDRAAFIAACKQADAAQAQLLDAAYRVGVDRAAHLHDVRGGRS